MTLTTHRINTRFCFIFGLTVWLLGTIIIRLFGQWIFLPESTLAITILFIVSIPIMLALMQLAYTSTNIQKSNKFLGAVYAIIPGLLFDGLLYAMPGVFFPNLSTAAAGLVATWLLWCYGWILISAFLMRSNK
jgi:Family of unknown function (DUF5367)